MAISRSEIFPDQGWEQCGGKVRQDCEVRRYRYSVPSLKRLDNILLKHSTQPSQRSPYLWL